MKTIKTLCTLLCVMLLTALSATAQNADDNKNKAIIEANDGNHELNTDDIQVIRFDGGKITVVQPWGETTFDRTLRSLSFKRPNPGMLRLTVNSTIGTESGSNRAQEIDGDGKLKSTWASGDVVYVYADENPDNASPIGILTPKSYGEKSTILQGDINASGLTDGVKTLYFSTKPRPYNFSTQDGTVESLFYFTAQANVTVDGGNASLSGNLTFTRPIAVVKFMLKDKDNSDAEISTKSFTVHDGTNTYTVTPATPTDEFFVGIPGISNKTVTLTATDGNEYYLYQRNGVSFTNNNYYAINVKMEASDLARPLTFEALGSGSIWFDNRTGGRVTYRKNGGEEKIVNFNSIPISAGDKVSFYGNNSSYDESHISVEYTNCYIYGNIMSLISSTDFAMTTTLTERDVFREFLMGENLLLNHPSKKLLLPATTLSLCCYMEMFYGCTGLTSAPELPATTLAGGCYSAMFGACTGLTSSPVLPAETLEEGCYENMFFNCSNLNKVTCLATDISADWCTANWLKNVAATGTFYMPASMHDWTTGVSGIPVGWSVNGKLPGQFTINSGGGKVNFSKGNLQYQANSTGAASAPYTGVWQFAEHQYDMIGSDNANISDSYTGWIDLFGWGTGDAPTKSSTNSNDYSTFTDWGTNAISNGGNTANMWSTLTKDEWTYLLEHHTKGWSTVNGVNGYVIRPDGVSTAVVASYTASEWAVEEAAGSVFLPAGNSRGGTTYNAGSWGDYWSSTPFNSADAYYLYFHSGGQNPASSACRWGGRAVRLVYETPYFQGSGTEADPYLISSAADWNYLAVKVNSGTSYAGKFFRQTTDIDITTMVGTVANWNYSTTPFSGTFDGDGNTLNVTLSASGPTAPFASIVNATIKNLCVTGSISTTSYCPASIAAFATNSTMTNCISSASVSSSRDGTIDGGGLVSVVNSGLTLNGCAFTGSITFSDAQGQSGGGFVGWAQSGATVELNNCVFAPSAISIAKASDIHFWTFVRGDDTYNLNNCYYNGTAAGNSQITTQGKFARSISAGTGVTVANAGAATVYNVSGITSYGTGILYDGVLYAGNGEAVSLTLSHGDAPTGFSFSQYTVTGGGSLNDPTSNSPTLTMSDANQNINAKWTYTQTFNYTGAVQTFTAPATGYYTLQCYGAQGGYSSSGLGGKGGLSQLTYPLTQGDILYIYVGGQGGNIDDYSGHPEGGDGGWNGGGKGGTGVVHPAGSGGTPYSGGGGGGGATHIATSAIGPITGSTNFTVSHDGLLLIAGGGGGGLSWGSNAGGAGGGDAGGRGRRNGEWNIDWNNGTLSCGKDGMTSSTGSGSAEGCGGGGAGYVGGNTWTVTYNANNQSYSGAGGSSWGETTNGKGYTTTSGGATAGGNGKAVITWYGTTYPTE